MFRIGDFSKLGQVTVRTLRLYDELGLFKPARTDKFTDYRYYAIEQLPRLNRILALKDLGFSLEEISALLDRNVPSDQLLARQFSSHAGRPPRGSGGQRREVHRR